MSPSLSSTAFVTTLIVAACAPTSPVADSPAKLLFSSGFEAGVTLEAPNDGYQPLTGTDRETGFSWPIDILGARESALHPIDHDDHQAVFARLETVSGPNGHASRALYQEMPYEVGDCCTQMPYEILDIQDGRRDLYVRFWIKLDGASLHKPYMWRTFFEWKSRDYANGDGFRLISFVYADENGRPFFDFQGDTDPENPVWEIENHSIPVPEDTWFLNEFYWHWSNGNDGRALWRVNGDIVADYSGPSTSNRKPIDFIMLSQIYGNSNPKHQWTDDIEIWSAWPTARAGALPAAS